MLVKVNRYAQEHCENIGLFDSQAKALAVQTALELESFDNGSLAGISFYIEEFYVR
jgi:hypothetical protein